MKAKVNKHKTREEMVAIFDSILETFEKSGATLFKGSFYINLYTEDGAALSFSTNRGHHQVDSFSNPVNDRLNADAVVESLAKEVALIPEVSRKRLADEYEAKVAERRAAEYEVQKKLIAERNAEKKRLADEESAFKRFLFEKHGVDFDNKVDRYNFLSSTGRITDERAMLKHFDGDASLIPDDGYVFRASLKNPEGGVGVIEIYNSSFELIIRYEK